MITASDAGAVPRGVREFAAPPGADLQAGAAFSASALSASVSPEVT